MENMDNQYTYYRPESEKPQNEEKSAEKKAGKKKYGKLMAKVVSVALVFGIVASAAFQGTNLVATHFLGDSTSGSSKTVESTKLTSGNSTKTTSDVAQIAENAMPSVVSITNMSVQQVQNFFGGVQEQESTSVGSGIIIAQNDEELLIVTNNHVVEGSETLTVTFIDGESVEAQVKGTDSAKDLAVVAVPLENIKDSTMDEIKVASMGDSDELQVGETVIAIGNALGYGQSVTMGIVSAKDRELDGIDGTLIQTDAAINPGNSGGALLNANGEVIGINTAKVATDSVEGMGYAIPISSVSDVIENLMNQETRTKVAEGEQGYLGIEGVDVTSESSQMYDMPEGVYVSNVIDGGGAQKAGLTKGSVITGLNGTTIDSMTTLKEQLQYYSVGETVELTVQVMGEKGSYEETTVKVELGENS